MTDASEYKALRAAIREWEHSHGSTPSVRRVCMAARQHLETLSKPERIVVESFIVTAVSVVDRREPCLYVAGTFVFEEDARLMVQHLQNNSRIRDPRYTKETREIEL